MQRALGASEPPGTPMMKLQASPKKVPGPTYAQKKENPQKSQNKDTSSPAETQIKDTSAPGSPQRKPPKPVEQLTKVEAVKGPESQKQVSPAPGQKTKVEDRKTGPQTTPDMTSKAAHKQSNATSATQEESRGFLFGGPKHQPDAIKPTESISGKMFGLGSSIFSSASTLMNSAVQDESKTPPLSPKTPATKETKSPLVQKQEQGKKQEQMQQLKASPLLQSKVEKTPSVPVKDAVTSLTVSKADQSTCPLCKMELNFGSNDPPNYNNCTECKNTVCNQCGFNPMTSVSEVKIKVKMTFPNFPNKMLYIIMKHTTSNNLQLTRNTQ